MVIYKSVPRYNLFFVFELGKFRYLCIIKGVNSMLDGS